MSVILLDVTIYLTMGIVFDIATTYRDCKIYCYIRHQISVDNLMVIMLWPILFITLLVFEWAFWYDNRHRRKSVMQK